MHSAGSWPWRQSAALCGQVVEGLGERREVCHASKRPGAQEWSFAVAGTTRYKSQAHRRPPLTRLSVYSVNSDSVKSVSAPMEDSSPV